MAVTLQIDELPSFPHVALQLLGMDPESSDHSAADIERIIKSDNNLVGNILKLANSSFYGWSGKVSDLRKAVNLLGMQTIRNMVLVMANNSVMSRFLDEPFLSSIQLQSVTGALTARHICARVPELKPQRENAFLAALLRDLGMVVIGLNARMMYADLLRAAREGEQSIVALEQAQIGTTHPVLGKALLAKWKVPGSIGAAILDHEKHAPPETADAVSMVIGLADAVCKRVTGLSQPEGELEREAAFCAALGLTEGFSAQYDDAFFVAMREDPIYKLSMERG